MEVYPINTDLELPYKASVITVVGKMEMGKSYLIKSLLRKYTVEGKYFKFGLCITKTAFTDGYDYLPKKYVLNGWNQEFVEKYFDKLAKMKKKLKDAMPANFLILDDLVGNLKTHHSALIEHIVTCHRHYNCTVFITTQYMKANVSPMIREVCKYAFLFRTKGVNSMGALYEAFGQDCDDEKEFREVLMQATSEEHQCLAYWADGDNKNECYWAFKADPVPENFKLKY